MEQAVMVTSEKVGDLMSEMICADANLYRTRYRARFFEDVATPGVIMGVVGAVVLLIMVIVWRKMENKELELSGLLLRVWALPRRANIEMERKMAVGDWCWMQMV